MSVERKLPDGYEFREGYLYRDGACISNFFARPTSLYHRQGDAFPFACDLEIHQSSGSKVLEHFLLSDLSDDWWKEPPPGCYYVSQQKNTHRSVRFVFQSLMESAPVTSVEEISELGWHRLPSGQMTYIAGTDILADNASIDSKHLWISDKIKGMCIESEPDTRIDDALQFFWDFFFLMPGITDILLTYCCATSFLRNSDRIFDKKLNLILRNISESHPMRMGRLSFAFRKTYFRIGVQVINIYLM